jgi:uncharacterized glyoxalase superfamily protein PhnB
MDSNTPNIFVKDINQTINFYKKLGFNLIATVPEEGDYVWAMMMCDNVTFMFQSFKSLGEEMPEISRINGGSLIFYIKLKDVQNFHDRIKDEVKILKGLEKTFYGATEFSIQDVNGYVLTFAEDEEKK